MPAQQQPVLERARLALVGVADDDARRDRLPAQLSHFTPVVKPAPPRPAGAHA